MRKLSWCFFLNACLGSSLLLAQKTAIYTHDSKDFRKAMHLYNDNQYASAQSLFYAVKDKSANEDLKADCSYYVANCAIRTNQSNGAELMEQFVEQYPTSVKQNQAYIGVGQYYFDQGDYSQAISWFDKVDESNLSPTETDRFNFQKGYSFFVLKNKKEAAVCLNKVVNSAEFGAQSKYYLGFMAYEGDDYKQATKYFDAVSGEEKYKEKLSYYQADMNFKLGNFQKAIDLGQKAVPNSNEVEKSELHKIIGESYFNLKQYEKAIPELELYQGKKGKWNNTDFYQLGYAYYAQKKYENAITQFNKIIGGNDFVAQNAYYHLGECYLKLEQKTQALNAFKMASEMDFELTLKEDAAFNYAKLSYEIGNSYQSVPGVLLDFLKKYPNNKNNSEIEKLLVDSYISSRNYKEALVLLEKNKTAENKLAYQKVLFFRGLELFSDENYPEALRLFDKATSDNADEKIAARALFWKGETQYVLGDFNQALISFTALESVAQTNTVAELSDLNYNLGYAHFKLKDYEKAAQFFQKHSDKGTLNQDKLHDSNLRLADCRFVTSNYSAAMTAYNKAVEQKSLDADYASFQIAICYGFLSKNDKKIASLAAFVKQFPKSDYRDDALFELANTYAAEKKQVLALQTFDQLIAEYKESSFTSRAILRQGLLYYNDDKDDQALAKFKKVAADFPKTPEALEAVSTARLLYVDNGRVDEYAAWVRTLDFVAVTDAELDNDTYFAAEKQFQQNKKDKAIAGFSQYINSFPNGIHILKANFYVAQLYFDQGAESKSVVYYESVIASPRNEFSEQALARLGQIYLKQKECNKAILVLIRLETEADFPQNKTFAQANLMKCYYEQNEYANAVVFADKVLVNPKTEDNVKTDAKIIIARSSLKTGDEIAARKAYEQVAVMAKGELAAEALYFNAYFKHKDGKYEESNAVVQKLAKNYASYKYFGGKVLVVMAKNFQGLKDSFQATYILENVIQNFTDFPDLILEAEAELQSVKTEAAKTNSSILK